MADQEPVAELHRQFSSDGATATPWAEARRRLETGDVYKVVALLASSPPTWDPKT